MWEKKSKQYNAVIFRTLFSYLSLNQSLESIFSIVLNHFWWMLPHIFYQPYNSRSLAYCRALLVITIWSRSINNIHLGHLIRSVSCRANNKSFLKHSIYLFRFKCKNKLSWNDRYPSLSWLNKRLFWWFFIDIPHNMHYKTKRISCAVFLRHRNTRTKKLYLIYRRFNRRQRRYILYKNPKLGCFEFLTLHVQLVVANSRERVYFDFKQQIWTWLPFIQLPTCHT